MTGSSLEPGCATLLLTASVAVDCRIGVASGVFGEANARSQSNDSSSTSPLATPGNSSQQTCQVFQGNVLCIDASLMTDRTSRSSNCAAFAWSTTSVKTSFEPSVRLSSTSLSRSRAYVAASIMSSTISLRRADRASIFCCRVSRFRATADL